MSGLKVKSKSEQMKSVHLTKNLTSTNAILIYLAFLKLILLLIFAGNYGLFRDEYYYIEVSKHLAWGYVDLQPLSPGRFCYCYCFRFNSPGNARE